MDLRGMLRIESPEQIPHLGNLFITEKDSIFSMKVYQTGLPQSQDEEFVGTLLIFANGETKLVEHRSED